MKVFQRIAGLLLCCAPSVVFAFHDGPIDGYVMDVGTGQPLAGVTVLATWERYEGVMGAGASTCKHAETAVSDAQGRYHIHRWGYFRNPIEFLVTTRFTVIVRAFKAGFSDGPHPSVFSWDDFTGELKLVKYGGTREARLLDLWHLPDQIIDCAVKGNEPLLPYYRAIYEEAYSLATNSERDQNILWSIKCEQWPVAKDGVVGADSICPKTFSGR